MVRTHTKKFTAKEKTSKKAQIETAKSQRGSWNGVNPVTKAICINKKTKLEKVYNREFKTY